MKNTTDRNEAMSTLHRKTKTGPQSIVEKKGDRHLTSQLAVGERRLIKVTEPHFVNRAPPNLFAGSTPQTWGLAAAKLHRSSVPCILTHARKTRTPSLHNKPKKCGSWPLVPASQAHFRGLMLLFRLKDTSPNPISLAKAQAG